MDPRYESDDRMMIRTQNSMILRLFEGHRRRRRLMQRVESRTTLARLRKSNLFHSPISILFFSFFNRILFSLCFIYSQLCCCFLWKQVYSSKARRCIFRWRWSSQSYSSNLQFNFGQSISSNCQQCRHCDCCYCCFR